VHPQIMSADVRIKCSDATAVHLGLAYLSTKYVIEIHGVNFALIPHHLLFARGRFPRSPSIAVRTNSDHIVT
jgi:hypothetical protein